MTKTESIRSATKTIAIESCQEWLQCEMSAGVRAAIPNTNNLIMVGPADWIAKNVPGVEAKAADVREGFEEWARRTHRRPGTNFDRAHDGTYKDNRIAAKWAAWQACAASLASHPQPFGSADQVSQERAKDAPSLSQAQAEPVAWMDPSAGCVMDAFLWQKDPCNPQYSQPVYLAAPMGREAQAELLDVIKAVAEELDGCSFSQHKVREGNSEVWRYIGKAEELAKRIRAIAAAPAATVAQGEQADEVRNAALEEAAQVAESEKVAVQKWHPSSYDSEAYNEGCDDSAAAIRALKRAGDTGEQADGGANA
jgi:hypothetical protein